MAAAKGGIWFTLRSTKYLVRIAKKHTHIIYLWETG